MIGSFEHSLPFDRGSTYFDGGTTDTTSAEALLGHTYLVPDTENSTGKFVILQVVRNESGGTLTAGDCVLYKATEEGLSIGGLGHPLHERFAGHVDSKYTSTIAANDIFYIIVAGPVDRQNVAAEDLLPDFTDALRKKLVMHGPEDDFHTYVAGAQWTLTQDSGGTAAIRDEVNGVIRLTNDTTDEDESILGTAGESFLFAQNKPIIFGAKVKVTEAATDKANVLVGLVSGAANAAIGDAGGGPPSSYSGACFFKVDSGTVWQAETSIGTTQSTDTDCGTLTSATYYELFCSIQTTSSTSATAKFYIDGSLVHTSTFTYTGATEMRFLVGVHNGSGAAEIMDVDYAYCKQLR